MKKLLATVLAIAMVLSMGSALAAIGWNQSTSSATINKGVTITVRALEFSGTAQDYTQYGLTNGTVWKEITGSVVKDTLIKFPVIVEVPSAAQAGLSTSAYINETITVTLTNATIWQIVDEQGNNISGSFSITNSKKAVVGESVLGLDGSAAVSIRFTILAIVDSTAQVNCNVGFTMGQKAYSDGTPIYFGKYVAQWYNGSALVVTDTSDNTRITFVLDANNKFTSAIYFSDPYLASGTDVPVSYCLQGELAFNGLCAHNRDSWPSDIVAYAWYEQVKADFNEIMNALGFGFSYGNVMQGYCTVAGLESLASQINTSKSCTVGGYTGIISNGTGTGTSTVGTVGTVAIPQTGAMSIAGFVILGLAVVAFVISRKRAHNS